MGINLKVYPRETLLGITNNDGDFNEELEHLYFERDYDIFRQISGFNLAGIRNVIALNIPHAHKCHDWYDKPLKYADCKDFKEIILPQDISIKNKAIINFLAELKTWMVVLFWC